MSRFLQTYSLSRLAPLLAVFLSAAVPHAQAAVNVLLDETFPATRTTVNDLPDAAAWYFSTSNATTTPGGSLTVNGNTGSTTALNLVSYFTSTGSPVTLAVGDSLSATFSFSLVHQSGVTVSNAVDRLRFGLYDSADGRLTGDGTTSSSIYNVGYAGYTAYLNTKSSDTSTSPLGLYQRNGGSATLSNTGTAHTQIGTRDGTVSAGNTLVDGQTYLATYIVSRTGADELSISLSVTGGSLIGFSGEWTTNATYTNFDTFAVVLGSGQIFESFTLDGVNITKTTASSVPEPASVSMLMGGGVLLVALMRQRR